MSCIFIWKVWLLQLCVAIPKVFLPTFLPGILAQCCVTLLQLSPTVTNPFYGSLQCLQRSCMFIGMFMPRVDNSVPFGSTKIIYFKMCSSIFFTYLLLDVLACWFIVCSIIYLFIYFITLSPNYVFSYFQFKEAMLFTIFQIYFLFIYLLLHGSQVYLQ